MELGTLMEARRVLYNHIDDKVSCGLAYKIMKFIKNSNDEDEHYSKEVKTLIEECAESHDDFSFDNSSEVKIKKEKMQDFQTALEKINQTDVVSPAIKFTIEELSELKLSAKEMFSLDGFINATEKLE